MDRCPTCNAKFQDKQFYHRCKTDLGPLLDIENRVRKHGAAAKTAFGSNDFNGMYFHARRLFSLMRTPETCRILACAALLTKRYGLALTLWKKL